MELFTWIFTPAFLLSPAAFTLFYPIRRGEGVDHRRIRRLRFRLWTATVAALALYVGVRVAVDHGALATWDALPRWMTWGARPDQLVWLLFFPLWFGLAMPLLAAVRPEMTSPHPRATHEGNLRSASLAPRAPVPVSRRAWGVGWAVWILSTLTVGARFLADETASPFVWLILAGGFVPLVLGPRCVQAVRFEPEPLDPQGSPELAAAYEAHRRLRARGFYGLFLTMAVLFSAFAVAAAWLPRSGAVLGWVGGLGGSLVGIAGAVFGVRMSHQRMQITRQLNELCSDRR